MSNVLTNSQKDPKEAQQASASAAASLGALERALAPRAHGGKAALRGESAAEPESVVVKAAAAPGGAHIAANGAS